LIEKLGESVDETDVYGRTPLMLACLIDDESTGVDIARLLLSHGASVCLVITCSAVFRASCNRKLMLMTVNRD